jgi:hypothetical protein
MSDLLQCRSGEVVPGEHGLEGAAALVVAKVTPGTSKAVESVCTSAGSSTMMTLT